MPVFYLDTSAILKRYRSEQGTDVVDSIYDERFTPTVVKSILRGVRSDVLVTSHFTCLEVESVAVRMLRGKLLDEKAHNALLNSFARDLEKHMTVLPVTSERMVDAIEAARSYALRPGDSLHAASARYPMTSAQDEVVFVCSDSQSLDAVEDDALMRLLNPESPDAMDQVNRYSGRRPIDLT